MIIFEFIHYKNFMAAGNSPIEIQLNKSKSTLIVGTNGSGKSSGLLDGITFALFGKPFRDIKKGQLINSINNKQCLVEVGFSIGTKKYVVSRGIKPDVFKIEQDGKLLDQLASARDNQAMLEEQILHLNYKTFTQVVLLSVANFKPFMQLDTAEKRAVVEDILGIKIFGAMNQKLKERVSTMREKINLIDNEIELNRQKLRLQTDYIGKLKSEIESKKQNIKELITKAQTDNEASQQYIDDSLTNIETLEGTIADAGAVQEKKYKLTGMIAPAQNKLRELHSVIQFYQHHQECPTCTQSIHDDIRNQHITKSNNKADVVSLAIEKLNTKIAEVKARESEIQSVQSEIARLKNEISGYRSSIAANQSYINSMMRHMEDDVTATTNIANEEFRLNEIAMSTKTMMTDKATLGEEKQYLDIAATLLKDSGIKSTVVAQYLPVMNTLINKYLAAMDVWISFELDSEFKETIKSRHRDHFTYHSFSEGEKQRIDLAILFTWRTIAKMKNSVSTNLLVFDEILDRALDTSGVEAVSALLDTLGEGTNVFVISHKVAELQDKFRSTIKFDKVNNFSQIV